MMRFDRFTERAQDAAARAYEVLTRYGHSQIDTEHLLMALLEQPEGVASQILVQLGVDPDVVIAKLDEELRKSPRATIYGGSTAQVFTQGREQVSHPGEVLARPDPDGQRGQARSGDRA
jgi:ATP-dependent Clp protease ATP-binding subunit ClpC